MRGELSVLRGSGEVAGLEYRLGIAVKTMAREVWVLFLIFKKVFFLYTLNAFHGGSHEGF